MRIGPVLASAVSTGLNTAGTVTTATPAVSSGVAFTPSATRDTEVYIPIAATTSGTYTVTYGPSTGAEHALFSALNLTAASSESVSVHCPASWKIVVTITGTTVAIGTVTTQTT